MAENGFERRVKNSDQDRVSTPGSPTTLWTWFKNKAVVLEHAAENVVLHVVGSFANAVAEGEREANVFVNSAFYQAQIVEGKLSGTLIDAEQSIVKLEQVAKSHVIKADDWVEDVVEKGLVSVKDSIANAVDEAGKGIETLKHAVQNNFRKAIQNTDELLSTAEQKSVAVVSSVVKTFDEAEKGVVNLERKAADEISSVIHSVGNTVDVAGEEIKNVAQQFEKKAENAIDAVADAADEVVKEVEGVVVKAEEDATIVGSWLSDTWNGLTHWIKELVYVFV
jgi:ElaB/YqjD/DUF883 family membrane-anchored ribosome-binding protein